MKVTQTIALLLAALALANVGCGHSAYNVRAFRTYATEDVKFAVTVDRIGDLAVTIDMIDELLLKTPYSPGDAWVEKLPLTDAEADTIRTRIANEPPYKDTSFKIPVIKLYRAHLREVLDGAKADNAGRTAKFASLMEGIGSLRADGDLNARLIDYRVAQEVAEAAKKSFDEIDKKVERGMFGTMPAVVPPAWTEARKQLREAKAAVVEAENALIKSFDATVSAGATSTESGDITRDGLTGLSVSLRLDLEALALIPILVVKAARGLPSALKDSAQDSLQSVANDPTGGGLRGLDRLSNLPSYAYLIEERLDRQTTLVETLTERLAKVRSTSLEKTPGLASLRESALDAVVGVTIDSLHVNVKAGGEGFFFNQISSQSGSEKDSKSQAQEDQKQGKSTVNDYTGRDRRVVYDVKPIWLAAGKIDVNFDWTHIPNAANLNFGYKTSVSSGGNIDTNGSLSKELGVSGVASNVLDFGLGFLGVKSSFRTATFTNGEVRVLQVNKATDKDTGLIIAKAPLQLHFQQIDIGYDLAFLVNEWAGRWYVEEFTLAFRKYDYTLPRIVYELEKSSTRSTSDTDVFAFKRQSPIQKITSEYYMGGLNMRFGPGEAPRFALFGDLGIFLGAGPTKFTLPRTGDGTGVPKGVHQLQSRFNGDALAGNFTASFGARYRFASPGTRLRLYVETLYHAEMIFADTQTQDEKKNAEGTITQKARAVNFGGTDVFHGPRLNLSGTFLVSQGGGTCRAVLAAMFSLSPTILERARHDALVRLARALGVPFRRYLEHDTPMNRVALVGKIHRILGPTHRL